MLLKDYVFGYADADTEFSNNPELFKDAFYDPNFYIDELIDGYRFLLVGRKGIGKTAYASKLRQISNDNEKPIDTTYIHLNEIDFSQFKKIADNKYRGTQKYQKIWDWIIGIEILKYLVKNNYELENNVRIIIKILNSNNIYLTEELPQSIRKISKKYAKFNINPIELGIEGVNESTSLDIYEFVEKIFDALSYQFINKKLFIIFDGLDDLLRFKIEKSDMIAGLIRASSYTNKFLTMKKINCKVLLLIRDDILSSIVDPDLNKIKRDSSINLRWDEEKIKELVNLRISNCSNNKENWYSIFPKNIRNIDSFDYILDFTLLRPRDILQFLNQAKQMYKMKDKLSYSETHMVLKQYSLTYFMDEIKDELSGFVDDKFIHSINEIFQKIGESDFKYNDFKNIINEIIGDEDDDLIWDFLQRLIHCSAIGQISFRNYYDKKLKKNMQKNVMEFFYKYPNMVISKKNKFHIHRALYQALHFSINS